ncbi:MAG TPA: acylneuraminate cytidylyltransferase family protein [Porphyromonadaceae bacterium]|nr:MAG: CMP-N-acetylneuraminic acid synthetase [Bacteroidetes bacterium GWC2_46_850]OFX75692.1 MAG: CMP-N-acetylneuraminic acid synthetase [Bacteroidetes bacterium GWC1_47_7]HBB01241.1 acylneuraminate cytidylyltransferase family protein [Porphyromonadaceae bacterium]
MKILYVIPARGGSKGVPHKNIKLLNGKPLIYYSIDVARQLTTDDHICVSTDDEEIIKVVENYGLKVPFIRPSHLATDTATTNDVLIHAINFYEAKGDFYDVVVLLQPTSPLRNSRHVKDAINLYTNDIDLVVSVKESHAASVICEENENGYLEFCFNKEGLRRQDVPNYYEYNGAIYIINANRLKKVNLSGFTIKKKYIMDEVSSIDIDTEIEWQLSEILIRNI